MGRQIKDVRFLDEEIKAIKDMATAWDMEPEDFIRICTLDVLNVACGDRFDAVPWRQV